MNDDRKLVEPRWPVILAILLVYFLLTSLRSRVHVFPLWVPHVATLVTITPLVVLTISSRKALWLRIQRVVIAGFFALYGIWTLLELTVLIHSMLDRSIAVTGLQLLTSSVSVWGTNIVMFSLAYWRLDRGGPEARINQVPVVPDWFFPIEDLPERIVPAQLSPKYVDYLFIAFTTATSFSPTEAMPLSRRAKLLMMTEGVISLVTILTIAARAINILGS